MDWHLIREIYLDMGYGGEISGGSSLLIERINNEL